MKKIIVLFSFLTALSACNQQPHYDQAMMANIQPCLTMGYQPAQCVASYQQFGHTNDNQWLENVAAFAAGAAVNHWWNRAQPAYSYNPGYWDSHSRVQNTTINKTYVIQQYDKPKVEAPSTNLTIKPIPEKNVSTLIPNQKVQPLFKPDVMVANQAKPTFTTSRTEPVKQASTFKPISVAPSKPSTFRPISVRK